MNLYPRGDERPWHIYVLKEPDTFAVRYVGWTIDLRRRLRDHTKPSRVCGHQHRDKWLASLIERGLNPVMEVVETGTSTGWADAERKWIAHYRNDGADLTNHTDGGEGALGRKHSDDAKRRMSEKRKGIKPSARAIEASITLHKGKPRPAYIHEKLRLAVAGKPKSPEHRAKLAAAQRGRKASLETRLKLSAMRRGSRPWNTGKHLTPEHRAKLSAAKIGKPKSDETKRRMREAARRREYAKRIGTPYH